MKSIQTINESQIRQIVSESLKGIINEFSLNEDLNANGKYERYEVGDLYKDGYINGIIASAKNGMPHLLISLNGPDKTMPWNNMLEYGKTLKYGWHIPSINELSEIFCDENVIDWLNRKLKNNGGMPINRWSPYWSRTEKNDSSAYCAYPSQGKYGLVLKNEYCCVRSVYTLW